MNDLTTPASVPDVSAETTIGHAAVKGAIFGYFAVLLLVTTLVFTMAGVGLGTALAVGAFAGIWGGPGWGGMLAAQICADRLEDDERRADRSTFVPSATKQELSPASGVVTGGDPGDEAGRYSRGGPDARARVGELRTR